MALPGGPASVLALYLFGGEGLVTVGGEPLDGAARDRLRVETDPVEDRLALGVVQELLGDAVQREGRGDALGGEELQQGGADTADAAVVLDAHHEAVVAGQAHERGVERLD